MHTTEGKKVSPSYEPRTLQKLAGPRYATGAILERILWR